MKAKVTKIDIRKSFQGGFFYYIFFKSDEGKSYKTCIYPRYGNFARWKPIIERWESIKYSIQELWLNGLITKSKNLIDADSYFEILSCK